MIAATVTQSNGTSVTLNTLDGAVAEPLLQTLAASPSMASNALGTVAAFAAKTSAGKLISVRATNVNAALRYLQIFNLAAAPATGAVPLYSIPIAAGSATVPGALSLGNELFGTAGVSFATGIALGISTTQSTYTAATAADHTVYAHYV